MIRSGTSRFSLSLSVQRQSMIQRLKEILLGHGGQIVCIPDSEPDAKKIVTRGFLQSGRNSISKRGVPCKCHSNSASLWHDNFRKNENMSIVTGYALSKDGIWRQHSWCILANGTIIETTRKRTKYFGFKMTTNEAITFFEDNYYL